LNKKKKSKAHIGSLQMYEIFGFANGTASKFHTFNAFVITWLEKRPLSPMFCDVICKKTMPTIKKKKKNARAPVHGDPTGVH
jgi:hypothetical protein